MVGNAEENVVRALERLEQVPIFDRAKDGLAQRLLSLQNELLLASWDVEVDAGVLINSFKEHLSEILHEHVSKGLRDGAREKIGIEIPPEMVSVFVDHLIQIQSPENLQALWGNVRSDHQKAAEIMDAVEQVIQRRDTLKDTIEATESAISNKAAFLLGASNMVATGNAKPEESRPPEDPIM